MSRWWTETVAALGDVVPLPLAALLLLLAALLAALAWYFFPAWVPRRLPRWRLPRLPRLRLPRRRRRSKARPADGSPPVPTPRAPEPVPARHAALADRLAAEGRYAEAVRERLRDMVRELVERQVVEPRAGMTVTELTTAAAQVRPGTRPALHAAGAVFSDLWYAQRPATPEHDRAMRRHAADLHRELAGEGERR
ncbi:MULTISPECIES: DUF4129 domain-containing protein [Micromonospora]|uniref:DUF4129 domain-containing protein n=1 Tax=Micromonospora solifontis TaxID=2487138 RepID=A0ABX9WHE0_9ACTN|nr:MULTISPECIES: DUF4129 domain-containing protein [Micromonospora]NES15283.1 DUF4129 domain-containing protein [Micromonospora sp. PPF5-17B]NES36555.1 DUF4129 domain-containing protein [Micromonospora solifontis]NES56301.1 DUF4129 domain-containing protein [Micromonospora sp. PPF5-6]RNL99441.1 DUF4129 domain-containing protein [Micromonospora solifontis]